MPPIEIPELKDYSPALLDSFFSGILAQFDQDAAAADFGRGGGAVAHSLDRPQAGFVDAGQRGAQGRSSEARREVGKRFNALKSAIEPRCDPEQIKATAPATDAIDITLPGTRRALGAEHPLIRTMNEIVTVFAAMGYSVGLGPRSRPTTTISNRSTFRPAIRRATRRIRWSSPTRSANRCANGC